MRNKRVLLTVCLFLVCVLGLGAEPYASVSFAEGTSFTLIRNNKPVSWSVTDGKVLGMELMPGDIIQTANATFVELVIHPIGATVQIAENTSFRCDADSTGKKSSGELYYGRVRAKVKKLALGSSYRIASPSLVAGVRGTDFGVDVVSAPKTDGAAATTASPVINRIFCFDGNVIVTGAGDAVSGSVSIGGNEMVEKADGDIGLPAKAKVSDDITKFWSGHPVSPAAAQMLAVSSAKTVNGLTVIDRPWPAGEIRVDDGRNLRIPNAMAAGLIGVGAVACSVFSALSANSGASPIETPYYTAGLVMIGSGSVLAVVSMLFERPLTVPDKTSAAEQ
jgi:hypothetical protein